MNNISICICTRQRQNALLNLLNSIDKINSKSLKQNYKVEIIVIENDNKPFLKNVIDGLKDKSKFPIKYFHEKNPGLCYARNRAVKETFNSDFILFVDDDQQVKTDLLENLVKAQKEFNADAIYGQNPPIFDSKGVPVYIQEFFKPNKKEYGQILKIAPTNCLYIRRAILNTYNPPFDLRLNFVGCEDLMLTHQLSCDGYTIRSNPDATAYEIIPKERATVKYIIKRSFRNMNSLFYYHSISNQNYENKKLLIKAPFRLIAGFILSIPCLLLGNKNKLKGIILISESCGVMYGIIHGRYNFYK
nr:glycosyltransferase family 2 protein [uncultured Draconibacterium sp.]